MWHLIKRKIVISDLLALSSDPAVYTIFCMSVIRKIWLAHNISIRHKMLAA